MKIPEKTILREGANAYMRCMDEDDNPYMDKDRLLLWLEGFRKEKEYWESEDVGMYE